MSSNQEIFARNRGIVSEIDQDYLSVVTVAIAGCGGDGGQLAETLARQGVCNFKLADPEVFSVENLNRQAGCYHSTLGRNKAEVIAERIRDINPGAFIEVYTEGVTETNVRSFLSGVNVVADEMEYTEHRLAVMLAREARQIGIPNIMAMNVAWGCLVTSFDPNAMTVEEFLGLDPEAPLDEIATAVVPLQRWVPQIPSYADMEVVAAVAAGKISAPSVAIGVQLAAGYAAKVILSHLFHQETVYAPQMFWADAFELKSGFLTIDTSVAS